MKLNELSRNVIGRSLGEIVLIVFGVLIALWVDQWRSEVQEMRAVQRHLIGIVEEIDSNRVTLHVIRDDSVPKIIAALESSIRVLDQPDIRIEDPEAFLRTLVASTESPLPWFDRNRFESLRTSEGYQSAYLQELASEISDAYESPNILFFRRFNVADEYRDAVSQFVPARFQSATNELAFYVPVRFSAPEIADEQPASVAVNTVLANRAELVRLARQKAQRLTAKWYAMTRIILEFQSLRDDILAHPLMQDVAIPASRNSKLLEEARI